jgi:hypothetical protein
MNMFIHLRARHNVLIQLIIVEERFRRGQTTHFSEIGQTYQGCLYRRLMPIVFYLDSSGDAEGPNGCLVASSDDYTLSG